MFRQLTEQQILAWADAYREARGEWPSAESGAVAGTPAETWSGVDRALREGLWGLPGGSSLARLLVAQRGARFAVYSPSLTEEQVLAWADAHNRQTGEWPRSASGPVRDAPFERWEWINDALRVGKRGLPGGSSLARVLAERRGVPNPQDRPDLTVEKILAWADLFHSQTGEWPTEESGDIPDSGGYTWHLVDSALAKGRHGLPGRSSLPRLLAERRGVRNQTNRPDLSVETILAWADAHRERTGKYPNARSGPVLDAPGETWLGVAAALSKSGRGLTVRTTLVQLLAAERGRRNHLGKPKLTRPEILTWADAHHQRTGAWPTADSGPIPESPGDTWCAVETALRDGCRGLPGGSSLAKLLARYRKKRNQKGLPDLVMKRIVAWAEAHFERTGEWPDAKSGPIPEAPGETWNGVQKALQRGSRGLPRRSSLAQLLARKRNVRNIRNRPPLTELQVLRWADAYYQKHGGWPSNKSGLIPGTAQETWNTVDNALVKGDRGVPGGSSLARFLEQHRGKRHGTRPPPLLPEAIRAWALAHRQATGRWPSQDSGPVAGVPGENWGAIDNALREGRRGLPGGSSLPRFLSNEPPAQS